MVFIIHFDCVPLIHAYYFISAQTEVYFQKNRLSLFTIYISISLLSNMLIKNQYCLKEHTLFVVTFSAKIWWPIWSTHIPSHSLVCTLNSWLSSWKSKKLIVFHKVYLKLLILVYKYFPNVFIAANMSYH